MKYIFVLFLAVTAMPAQTGTKAAAGISGTVVDAKTLKPVPGALVMASRAGAPPFARNTKSGGDGAFQIQGLAAGNYLLCVQAPGDQYLTQRAVGTTTARRLWSRQGRTPDISSRGSAAH